MYIKGVYFIRFTGAQLPKVDETPMFCHISHSETIFMYLIAVVSQRLPDAG